ncbi:hypothetical protein D9611_004061 [Ephemerocybe angulata]|uniref:F-box domain-containing protein n=1 Tax=Ephemerocybe angulata TaxID=980116 RepID=A0A8H5F5Y1_9AGAR|nr:hypothetical protein D9611_004061 [Tulosesus angulatus]
MASVTDPEPIKSNYASIDLSEFTESERQLLDRHQETKKLLEERRIALKKELEQVEFDIIESQRHYGELVNAHSALSKLPADVLGIIFEVVLHESRATGRPSNPLPEVTITHVCGLWRRVALAMSSMWNVFCYDGSVALRVPLDRLEAYLERSKEYPLELWFSFTGAGEGWTEQFDMLRMVIPHMHHCRVLHILSDDDSPIEDLYVDLEKVSAPMLEVFAMCPDKTFPIQFDLQQTGMNEWSPTTLFGAPSLKYLRLDTTSFDKIRPPLDTIVDLRLERRRIHHAATPYWFEASMLDHILSLPNLETLSLWRVYVDITDPAYNRHAPVRARSLKHFRCDGALDFVPHYFLSNVSAPALESITIDSFIIGRRELRDNDNVFPSLHTLVLNKPFNYPPEPARLFGMMKTTRNAKHLVLSLDDPRHDHTRFLDHMAEAVILCDAWSGLEQLTLNMRSRTLEPGYRQLMQGLPKLSKMRVPQLCLDDMKENNWELPARVGLEVLEDSKAVLPLSWPAGPSWLDIEEDPFITAFTLLGLEQPEIAI